MLGNMKSTDKHQSHLYFFILYLSANPILSSSTRDFIYAFHPGHQFACHLHIRPKKDLGSLSYLALKLQFSQLWSAILNSPQIALKAYVLKRTFCPGALALIPNLYCSIQPLILNLVDAIFGDYFRFYFYVLLAKSQKYQFVKSIWIYYMNKMQR